MIVHPRLNYLIRQDLITILMFDSIALTLLIAFIDEERYDLSWIYDMGSWGAFVVYSGIFLAIQLLIFKVILGKFEVVGKAFSYFVIISSITLMIYFGITSI